MSTHARHNRNVRTLASVASFSQNLIDPLVLESHSVENDKMNEAKTHQQNYFCFPVAKYFAITSPSPRIER